MTGKKTLSKAQELRDAVNATLGADTVRMATHEQFRTTYTPTGLLPLDILLQGGMPRGRMVELYGDYSTLKSYIGYCCVREFQRQGKTAAVIDTEHSFDADWAEQVGVNLNDLIIERPATGELAMDIMETLVRGGVDFILIDSISTLLPQTEQKKRLHDESLQPARLAQLMSAGLRKLTSANTNTSFLWINQTRVNIGITFGSNEATTGGKSMPFYASYRIRMNKAGKITRPMKFWNGDAWADGKEQIGQKFRAEVVKSKLSKPFREIWFDWNLVEAQIDLCGFVIGQGIEAGIVNKSGNTWSYGTVKVVGREKFKDAMGSKPDVLLSLENDIREYHGLPTVKVSAVSPKVQKSIKKRKVLSK